MLFDKLSNPVFPLGECDNQHPPALYLLLTTPMSLGRHVPRFIVEVPQIPTTINGKKVEAAVKQTLSGKDVTPSNTVVNPDSIAYFRRFRELEREPRSTKL